jgi:glucose/arabinose dehydrogenase
LSIAFDPKYATNGYLYAYYTDAASNLVLERFSSVAGASTAGPSAGVIMNIVHGGSEHHGGMIAFGPDQMLYLAPGDGGCCGDPKHNAQNLGTLLGKVLRIDVRTFPYTIPPDNPMLTRAGAMPEIWAYGLRNAWRFSFDSIGGTMILGDVGQDSHEEVDVASVTEAGLNYGWPFTEGLSCYSPATGCLSGQSFRAPVLDYPHSDGCSVIGGYVYRGAAMPELAGHYLYLDFCKGWIRSFRPLRGAAFETTNWAPTLPFANSFGQDAQGELYLTSGTKVYRIVRAP